MTPIQTVLPGIVPTRPRDTALGRRALYAARHERRDGEDVRVMSVEDWEAVRDAVAAAIAALAMLEEE